MAAQVVQPNNNIHIVDLTAGTCTCWRFQAHGIPCGHAISLLFSQGQTLNPWMPRDLSIATLQAQYSTPLPPVDISALAALDTDRCEPPMTRVPRGRPNKDRIRKEDARARRGVAASAMVTLLFWAVRSRCRVVNPAARRVTIKRPHS